MQDITIHEEVSTIIPNRKPKHTVDGPNAEPLGTNWIVAYHIRRSATIFKNKGDIAQALAGILSIPLPVISPPG